MPRSPRRRLAPALLLGLAAGAPGAAAQADSADPVVVTGRLPARSCTRVTPKGGRELDLDCLNGALVAKARASEGAPPAVPSARSDMAVPSRVGTFSYSATRQRMGPNFGKSARPFRPSSPSYASTIVTRKPR
jgi:hypothetical protein